MVIAINGVDSGIGSNEAGLDRCVNGIRTIYEFGESLELQMPPRQLRSHKVATQSFSGETYRGVVDAAQC
ncbi:hypothetical protein NZK35_07800 [Stieleria sp. ICT_E10.1]|uniref:hypothetical protein n=1 Tax=Stieleria sedimenti TaxID=2976331 RepID=UPI00217F2C97|nr:hypothetical protein [Stieleria sedimenti]MCS7466544.1 hypothetical protein [Stieleria sedimenti]